MKRKYVQALLAGVSVLTAVSTSVTSVAAATVEKEQTVYVTADETGDPTEVIVSNWLKNDENEQTITDSTALDGIKNVKGDEEYTTNSDGTITWKADGNDIYYQGNTDEKLPVGVKVTYYLNDKAVSASEIAGKSGKVRIRIDYENYSRQTVEVDGKKQSVYTPFMMATGMVLPSETFSNVKVTNGKVISDGNRVMVVGIGFPGLSESLKLNEVEGLEDKEIPDYVEVTADAENFALDMTATVATTGTLNELGLDEIDSIDDLKDSIDELTDASARLVDGSKELRDGIQTLDDSAVEFVDGLKSADEGTGKLKDGIDTMNNSKGELLDGLNQVLAGSTRLKDGAGQLQEGITAYTGGTNSLKDGLAQLQAGLDGEEGLVNSYSYFQSKLGEYTNGADTIAAGTQALIAKLNQIQSALTGDAMTSLGTHAAAAAGEVTSAAGTIATYNAKIAEVNSKISEVNTAAANMNAAKANIEAALSNPDLGFTPEQIAAIQNCLASAGSVDGLESGELSQIDLTNVVALLGDVNNLSSLVGSLGSSQEEKAMLAALDEGTKNFSANSAAINEGAKQVSGGIASVSGAVSALKAGADTLTGNNTTLIQGSASLVQGAAALEAGSGQLVAGGNTLSGGITQLADGAASLKDGTSKLAAGGTELKSGTTKLLDGSNELADGMKEFDEEGIRKLADMVNVDLQKVLDRLQAVTDADKEYTAFDGWEKDAKGNVKFFIETAAVETE